MSTLTVQNLRGVSPTNMITVASGHKIYSPGSVVQVVATPYTTVTTFSGSSEATGTDIGFQGTITPVYNTSKIYVNVTLHTCSTDSYARTLAIRLFRNGSVVSGANGVPSGSRIGKWAWTHHNSTSNSTGIANDDNHSGINWGAQYLDSPASTSTLTYSVRMDSQNGQSFAINRTRGYSDNGNVWASTPMSFITLMEIAQ